MLRNLIFCVNLSVKVSDLEVKSSRTKYYRMSRGGINRLVLLLFETNQYNSLQAVTN